MTPTPISPLTEHAPPPPQPESASPARRGIGLGRAFAPWIVNNLWVVNLTALALLCVWIPTDGLFSHASDQFGATLASVFAAAEAPVDARWLNIRLVALGVAATLAVASLAGIFAALFLGPHAHRRLRSWLAFTAAIAAWLTLLGSWRELAWQGQQWRVARHIDAFEPLLASLKAHWPSEDAQHPELGPLMAYPRHEPRTLLLLGQAPILRDEVSVSAVERSERSAIRFELSPDEQRAWLEWHPSGSLPASFTGGLEGHYEIERQAPLGNGWYLVRYRHPTRAT